VVCKFIVRIPFEGVYAVKRLDLGAGTMTLALQGGNEKTVSIDEISAMGIETDVNAFCIGETHETL